LASRGDIDARRHERDRQRAHQARAGLRVQVTLEHVAAVGLLDEVYLGQRVG
jgi:hypothetical protein